jgi:hypothetical protein
VGNEVKDDPSKDTSTLIGTDMVTRPKTLQRYMMMMMMMMMTMMIMMMNSSTYSV